MKKTSISIPIEEEKLVALRLFAGKKGADFESELEDALQKLYEKRVPKDARALVDMMAGGSAFPKGREAKKPAPARPAKPDVDGENPSLPSAGGITTPGAAAAGGGQHVR